MKTTLTMIAVAALIGCAPLPKHSRYNPRPLPDDPMNQKRLDNSYSWKVPKAQVATNNAAR